MFTAKEIQDDLSGFLSLNNAVQSIVTLLEYQVADALNSIFGIAEIEIANIADDYGLATVDADGYRICTPELQTAIEKELDEAGYWYEFNLISISSIDVLEPSHQRLTISTLDKPE